MCLEHSLVQIVHHSLWPVGRPRSRVCIRNTRNRTANQLVVATHWGRPEWV